MTWCSTCRAEVPAGHATVIGGSERGSGVPTVRYGCAGQAAAGTVALSSECTMATSMGWDEQHTRCLGRAVTRIPAGPDPIPCGCTCHAGPPTFIGRRGLAPVIAARALG